MPYYVWKGSDSQGKAIYGRTLVRTLDRLEKELLKKEIALVVARKAVVKTIPLSKSLLRATCENMSSLLNAGLRLDEALELCGKTSHHELLKFILLDSAQAVREGNTLSETLEEHTPLVDSLLVALVKAGEESGSLLKTFRTLDLHYKTQDELSKKFWSAILMPCITFFFFCIITIGIFALVIPRFESLFLMLGKPVPGTTRFLFSMSTFFRSTRFIFVLCVVLTFLLAIFSTVKWAKHRISRDKLVLRVPVSGKIILSYSLTLFLQTLAVLLESGVHLVKAIELSSTTIRNEYLKNILKNVCRDVESGISLSASLASHTEIWTDDIRALCTLGEASGTLSAMIQRASHLYHRKTYAALSLITTLVPPLLLVMLGSVIALLIFAVYSPLLNLSHVIG